MSELFREGEEGGAVAKVVASRVSEAVGCNYRRCRHHAEVCMSYHVVRERWEELCHLYQREQGPSTSQSHPSPDVGHRQERKQSLRQEAKLSQKIGINPHTQIWTRGSTTSRNPNSSAACYFQDILSPQVLIMQLKD